MYWGWRGFLRTGIKWKNRIRPYLVSSVQSICHGLEEREAKGLRWELATQTFSVRTRDFKWKRAFLGMQRSPSLRPQSDEGFNCIIYIEWKGSVRLSLNPLLCNIHLHFLFLLPVEDPFSWQVRNVLASKRCRSDTDSTQWVENVAFSDVSGFQCSVWRVGVEKKRGSICSTLAKHSDIFTYSFWSLSKGWWLIGITLKWQLYHECKGQI